MIGSYPVFALEEWVQRVFQRMNVPPQHAATAAALLVRSDVRGYTTHGIGRLPAYVERLESGEFNPTPTMRPRVEAAVVELDADGAMGHVAAPTAIELGLAELQRYASVFISVRDCGHLGALGIHTLRAAEGGAFCLAGQRTPPRLAMPGFNAAAIGHNPISFACPLPGQDPIVFDIACSVAARGHIMKAAREGRPIPAGWAIDSNGDPTTDAEEALKGNLLPMAGHKGLGLAMLIQCLTTAFTVPGAAANRAATAKGAGGRQPAFFWLLAPDALGHRDAFRNAMNDWTGYFLDVGGEAARLPGHRGAALERRARENGLAFTPSVEGDLRTLGDKLGVPFPSAGRG